MGSIGCGWSRYGVLILTILRSRQSATTASSRPTCYDQRIVLMSVMVNPFRALAWRLVKGLVHRKFPTVESISVQQLAAWLERDRPSPTLIDVRQDAEYAVSHLPGARHLPSVAAIQQAKIPADASLVLYCSVGYRSARLAEQLRDAGYPNVMNLEGSIFEWYNRGYPVVVNQEPVQRVHPYSRTWGWLLKSS